MPYLFYIDKYGNTALHNAAFNGTVTTIKFLINRGCDISIRNHVSIVCYMLVVLFTEGCIATLTSIILGWRYCFA